MARPKDGSKPGNNKHDQAFLDKATDAGLLEPIDEPNDGSPVPFSARMKFTGRTEDWGSLWQLPPPEGRCVGTAVVRDEEGQYVLGEDMKPLRRRCLGWRIRGARVCQMHGGRTAGIKRAAQMRLLMGADVTVGALIDIVLNKKLDARARVMAAKEILDRCDIKGSSPIADALKPFEEILTEWAEGREAETDAVPEDEG